MKTVFHYLIILLLFTGLARADFESVVIELVNAERQDRGIKPLSYDADLAAAARLHSQDMGDQDYFSHDSLDGAQFYDRIIDEGYDYNLCGENIATGQSGPEYVVDTWMNTLVTAQTPLTRISATSVSAMPLWPAAYTTTTGPRISAASPV